MLETSRQQLHRNARKTLDAVLYRVAGVVHINFNEQERRRILEIFNIRLHSRALNATHCGFDTQRNEAFNRVLIKNLPKNVIFTKKLPW